MGSGASSPSTVREDISIGNIIGEGSFATVRRAVYIPKCTELAVKVICVKDCLSRKGSLNILKSEITALKTLQYHPLLCNLHFAYHDNVNCYMVMDLLEGGDLRHHINNSFQFTEKCIAFIAACISSALHHVHSHGIIHRDVKPENIVLDRQGYPRLCDFGISHTSSTASGSMVCSHSSGTLCYLAPEILTSSQRHSTESDFWSLGIVLYELMFLKRPFSKHCPRSFVHFVGELYDEIWDSSKYVGTVTTHLSYRQSEASIPVSTPVSLNDTADDVTSVESMPLPQSLQVNLPSVSAYGIEVSPEFKSLIQGLLDVRVPQRLGSGATYNALRGHSFFENLGVPWDSLLDVKYPSPLDINLYSISAYVEQNFAKKSSQFPLIKREKFFNPQAELNEALQLYSYTAPQYKSPKVDISIRSTFRLS
mmetsp:Transcript_6368/g.9608  ORF Transcript_6368/g.9608 Transcript_6368/m.9608 type:complete len:423 (+) Transcript_6368:58-1326(+)